MKLSLFCVSRVLSSMKRLWENAFIANMNPVNGFDVNSIAVVALFIHAKKDSKVDDRVFLHLGWISSLSYAR